MRKILYHPNNDWFFVKRWALHHDTIVIEYHHNLGRVSRQIYKSEGFNFDDYVAKNHKQQLRDAEEHIKKNLEVR